jgi:hypothetical protein
VPLEMLLEHLELLVLLEHLELQSLLEPNLEPLLPPLTL